MANLMLYKSMSKGFFAASESLVWDLGVCKISGTLTFETIGVLGT